MNFRNRQFHFWSILFLAVAVASQCGCEPLRKKFVRKKKEAQVEGVQPVLEPITYPEKVEDAASSLRYRYSLWGVWYGEITRDIAERSVDKRIIYDLNQLALQVTEMQKLFVDEQKNMLAGYGSRIQKMIAKISYPAALGNRSGLESDLRVLDKEFRKNFRPEVAQEFLVR